MRFPAFLALLICSIVAFASAQPGDYTPGSVLLYPTVDSRGGLARGTIISVTNTNTSFMVSPTNNFRYGDIQLHFYYVAGLKKFNNTFNRKEFLTPGDTLALYAGSHDPEMEIGYLVVVAEDPESEAAIDFDYLIGDETVADLAQNKVWSVPAIAFRSRATGSEVDNNGRAKTDHPSNGGNGNGSVDFDGTEYDMYPDQLMISSFLQQSSLVEGEVVLVSPLGAYYMVQVNFLFYDNEEDVYSRNFMFFCWTSEKLANISVVTRGLGGDPNELPTGWARIDGDHAINIYTGWFWDNETPGVGATYDPPLVGAFFQSIHPGSGFKFGHLLHHTGTQNGNEFPWDYSDD